MRAMNSSQRPIRFRLDRLGVFLSGLCAVHCVAVLVLVAVLGISGGFLLNPMIHRVGLALAMLIAAVAIGGGALRHRKATPFVLAMMGLTFMGGALAVPHGVEESALTIIGVSLVIGAHILNLRHSH
jgi:hypothetical protein